VVTIWHFQGLGGDNKKTRSLCAALADELRAKADCKIIMKQKVVDIADMALSDSEAEILITYSLGSCLGVTAFDPQIGIGGMIHSMLPVAQLDPEKAKRSPAMFVDTGVPALFNRLFNAGARKQNLMVTLTGAARVLKGYGKFRIGERNLEVCQNILSKNGIPVCVNDTGGEESRTIALNVRNGIFTIRCGGKDTVYELSS